MPHESVFSVAVGRAAGMTEWELFRPGLRRPARGWRSAEPAPDPDDVVARCRELLPMLPRTAVFSHATALDILDVDHPRGLRSPDLLHIEVPATTRRPRRQGVVSHAVAEHRPVITRHRRLPLVPPVQVWVQLAAELEPDELVVLGDALTRRHLPWTDLDSLRTAVDALRPGTRGIRRLARALPLIRPGTDSCPETRLRLAIVRAGLRCPEVNRAATDASGQFLALPDLSYSDLRIAIEYDGDLHRTDRETWRRDIARRRRLEAAGWRILTCTAADLRAPETFLTDLARAVRSAPSVHFLSPISP